MHWLDRAAVFASARIPPEKRLFNLGWGDHAIIDLFLEEVNRTPPIVPISLMQRPARRSGNMIVRDLSFESPLERLPERVRRVRARWVTQWPEPQRVVLLHPGWNDESHMTRTKLARILLDHDIASIMPEHPFDGGRRRDPGQGTPVEYVSDFCLMSQAAVLEGLALARHFYDRGCQVGVAGYSMGGNTAGFIASTMDVPVAPTPIATSYSPGPVFFDGVLRHTIGWDALGGETEANVAKLSTILNAASILNFPAPDHTKVAVIVAATKDGFIPNATTLALHRHWPGSRMDWVNAGHRSLVWRDRDRMAAAIIETLDRLDAFLAVGRK